MATEVTREKVNPEGMQRRLSAYQKAMIKARQKERLMRYQEKMQKNEEA